MFCRCRGERTSLTCACFDAISSRLAFVLSRRNASRIHLENACSRNDFRRLSAFAVAVFPVMHSLLLRTRRRSPFGRQQFSQRFTILFFYFFPFSSATKETCGLLPFFGYDSRRLARTNLTRGTALKPSTSWEEIFNHRWCITRQWRKRCRLAFT
jgi:hypothetical protein